MDKINWAAHWSIDSVIIHTPRWSFKLRAPWHYSDYSERYVDRVLRVFGWRFLIHPR